MSSSSFYSQAGNFIDAVQGGVSPRTGLFSISLPLMNLRSADLTGPALALALRYSPLSSADQGFGRGFSLNLTRYDISGRRLHLSTGEAYPVSSSGNEVRQHKFRNFTLEHTDGLISRVIHKSGLVETLARFGSVAYTTQIADPSGRVLHLQWKLEQTLARLSQIFEIKNGKRHILCQVKYPEANTPATTFTLLPDDASSGFDMVFTFGDGVLQGVTSYADTPERTWTFTYDKLNPFITKWQPGFLTGMTSPTGLTESVVYPSTYGMTFPDGVGLAPLPCVTRHDVDPGGGQPVVTTLWEWTEENYLGKNAPGRDFSRWQPDTDLMLDILSPDYVYGSTAKILDAAGRRVVSSVTRRYNNFHQQLSESTLRDGKNHTVTTAYYARSGATMPEQPPQYLLPQSQTETWQDNSGSRKRVTRWLFDSQGNLIREWAPDGTRTTFIYYHAQGEKGCPADPHGFTRYLKRKTVTPPHITGKEVPVTSKHYWKKLSSLAGNGYAVVASKVVDITGSVRSEMTRSYYTDVSDGLLYGREKQRKTTLTPDTEKASGVSYTRTEAFTCERRSDGLLQSATLTAHDGLSVTRSTLRHPVLGLLLSETDAQGVQVVWTYDKTGRVLTRIMSPGTPYEQRSAWAYAIESSGPVTTETDAAGNQVRTRFDGAGREIKRERLDIDSTKKWFEVSSKNYVTTGEVITSTASDWLTAEPAEQYIIRTGFTYNGWGNLQDTSSSDSVLVRQYHDPVKLTQTVFAKGSAGGKTLDTSTSLTGLDERSYLPQYEKVIGSTFKAGRSFEWDGAGQLRQVTDENGRTTQYTYDVLGRVLTQTLPDGTVVSRTYAPHLTGNQVTGISVTGKDTDGQIKIWQPGTQTFDGLGRLAERVSGGRTTVCSYDGASPVPSAITLPSGKKVSYAYIPELGNVVSSVTADSVTQTFHYNPATGALLAAGEGNTSTEYTLSPSGRLKTEKFTQADTTREAGYLRTLAGAVNRYRDIAGKETKYTRDSAGRLKKTADADLTTDLQYDLLGRLSAYTVTDPATKVSYTTTLTYDDAGREVSRTLTDGTASHTLTVTQDWTLNSLLAERITQWGGMTVRKETCFYDIRNRLSSYKVLGSRLPQDAYGKEIKAQTYQYDALNNLTTVTTTLADNGSDTATCHYGNSADPMQLTSVTHTHDSYPRTVTLKYDAAGCMTLDEAGRILVYDAPGRLVSVSGNGVSGGYGYDALNQLVSQNVGLTDTRQLYYRGGERVNETRMQENKEVRLIKSGHACVGVRDGDSLTLTAGDHHDSLVWSRDVSQGDAELYGWSPYGSGQATDSLPGFNGEQVDPVSGTYHLGNGYRAYSPVLMRFTCPDSLSPFGGGGINPYAYCAGDPMNLTDPSGHLGQPDYFGGMLMAAATIAGLAAALLSGGLAIAAAGGVMAAVGAASTTMLVAGGMGVASDVTALAGIALADSHPEASSALGWASLAAVLAGMGGTAGRTLWSSSGAGKKALPLRLRGGGSEEEFLQVKAFHLLRNKKNSGADIRLIPDSGYVNNYAGTGEPLIAIHGSSGGQTHYTELWSISGSPNYNSKVLQINTGDIKLIVDHIRDRFGIDLYSINKPLYLMSCHAGGAGGIAQKLANLINTPVRAFGDANTIIYAPSNLRKYWFKGVERKIIDAVTGSILSPITYYPQ
jgi:RHS repeat-associated protein